MGGMSLQEMLNSCVRKEAIDKTLVTVYENRGRIIVKDYSKLSCTRITTGAPRINYSWSSNLFIKFAKMNENLGGTALPICLYIEEIEPLNIKSSGKVCILAYSLTVILLFPLG